MYNRVRSMFRNGNTRDRSAKLSNRSKRRPELENLEGRLLLTGSFVKLNNPIPNGDTAGTMLQLTDGTIMVEGGGQSNNWYKLTPDATGSYVNGTWTTLASMHASRLYMASDILPDGRVFVAGGEYSSDGSETNTGEIYDPATNTWSAIANFPESEMGDQISELLPDGTILTGSFSSNTYVYNPATNAWSNGATLINGDSSGEEGWVKLADGSTLTYQIEGSQPQTGARLILGPTRAQDQWVSAGSVPVQLDSNGGNNGLVPGTRPWRASTRRPRILDRRHESHRALLAPKRGRPDGNMDCRPGSGRRQRWFGWCFRRARRHGSQRQGPLGREPERWQL